MRVKLQLVICNDKGDEETVTDVITLNKNHQRIEHLGLTLAESKHLLSTLQRQLLQQQITTFLDTRSTCPDCGQPLVSHLVWHVEVLESAAGALRLHTAHDLVIPAAVGAADRVGGPGAAVYGSQVVLSGVLWDEPGGPPGLLAA